MANMNWENIKERNGRQDATLPDLKVNDCFLFEGEDKDAQGHIVTDIYSLSGCEHIIVQYMPEWTPVCNESMFKYGIMKFSLKYPK